MPTSNFTNNRIFYACQAVLTKERQTISSGGDDDPDDGTVLSGVQSIGIDTGLERTPYSDFGRFQKEYGSYGKQTFTISIQRVVDASFFYEPAAFTTYEDSHLLVATNLGVDGFSGSLRNWDITLIYVTDASEYVGASGTKVSQTTYRSCLLTQASYTLSVDGTITESLTFISGIATHNEETDITQYNFGDLGSDFTDNLLKRQDIDTTNSVFPTEVERAFNIDTTSDSIPIYGLQTIEIGMTIDYTDLFDEGEFGGARTSIGSVTFAAGDGGTQNDLITGGTFGGQTSDIVYEVEIDGEDPDTFKWKEGATTKATTVEITGVTQNLSNGVTIHFATYDADLGRWVPGTTGHDAGDKWTFTAAQGADVTRVLQNQMKQIALPVAVAASFTGVVKDQYQASEVWDWELTDQNFGKKDGAEDGTIDKYQIDEEINIVAQAGSRYFQWILGKRNYLTALTYSGGDAAGGNVEATLSYQNEHSDFITYSNNTAFKTTPTPTNNVIY